MNQPIARTELDKLRDTVSDIIQDYFNDWEPHLHYTVENYDMADRIIEALRPDLVRDTPADWNGA